MQCQPALNLPIFLFIYLLIYLNVFFYFFLYASREWKVHFKIQCLVKQIWFSNVLFIRQSNKWWAYDLVISMLLLGDVNAYYLRSDMHAKRNEVCLSHSRQRFFVWMWWVEIKFQSSATSRNLTNTWAQAYMWRVIKLFIANFFL